MRTIVSVLLRLNIPNQTTGLALITLAAVERAKVRGTLNRSVSTRFFQRRHNIHNVCSISVVKQIALGR